MSTRPSPTCELAAGVHERLIAIARAALPNEACGLLAGPALPDIDAPVSVHTVWPVANSLRSPHRFALDGAGMLDAEDRIDAANQAVIGIFHSHPTSQAVPSATDRSDADRWDPQHRFVHALISMQGFVPTIRVWRLHGAEAADMVELPIVAGDTSA